MSSSDSETESETQSQRWERLHNAPSDQLIDYITCLEAENKLLKNKIKKMEVLIAAQEKLSSLCKCQE